MTTMTIPKFIDSKYFIAEYENWHLREDAPDELIKEFNKWISQYNNTPIGKEIIKQDEPTND